MAKNSFAIQLANARAKGVQYGLMAMEQVTLVAAENVLPDYIEDDQMPKALQALEKEMQRIWIELREEHSAEEATDILVGHAFQIRAKRNMDVIDG